MEFLLLWLDDLDDAVGAVRHLAPQIAGFLLAAVLFVATGVALTWVPQFGLPVVGLFLSASLLELARRRRSHSAAEEAGPNAQVLESRPARQRANPLMGARD